jgi:hypothetical protein
MEKWYLFAGFNALMLLEEKYPTSIPTKPKYIGMPIKLF